MPVVFESVRHKLARAKHHLDFYKTEASGYALNNPGYAVFDADLNVNTAIKELETRHPIPPHIPLIIGDCLQNLRSALDYLIWEVVVAEGSQPGKTHAFPICTTFDNFQDSLKRKRLEGIRSATTTEIEKFQPYCNGQGYQRDLLYILDELTNINKHRRILLAVLKADFVLGQSEIVGSEGSLAMNISITAVHDDTQIPVPVTTGQMKMNHRIVASIVFDEGCAQRHNVLGLLDAITKHAEGIVSALETFFS